MRLLPDSGEGGHKNNTKLAEDNIKHTYPSFGLRLCTLICAGVIAFFVHRSSFSFSLGKTHLET